MCMALSSGLLLTMAMTLLRNVWGHMYSNDPEVVACFAKMLPVLGISFFMDSIHGTLSGGPGRVHLTLNSASGLMPGNQLISSNPVCLQL